MGEHVSGVSQLSAVSQSYTKLLKKYLQQMFVAKTHRDLKLINAYIYSLIKLENYIIQSEDNIRLV